MWCKYDVIFNVIECDVCWTINAMWCILWCAIWCVMCCEIRSYVMFYVMLDVMIDAPFCTMCSLPLGFCVFVLLRPCRLPPLFCVTWWCKMRMRMQGALSYPAQYCLTTSTGLHSNNTCATVCPRALWERTSYMFFLPSVVFEEMHWTSMDACLANLRASMHGAHVLSSSSVVCNQVTLFCNWQQSLPQRMKQSVST